MIENIKGKNCAHKNLPLSFVYKQPKRQGRANGQLGGGAGAEAGRGARRQGGVSLVWRGEPMSTKCCGISISSPEGPTQV